MTWLAENKGTILVGAVLLVLVISIIRNIHRKKKQRNGCSCSGGCGSCGGSCH